MLQRTRFLIVIGYSVPQTDLTSQALIRSSLSEGNLRLLVVANPDPEARARVIDLARGAISSKTRILELDRLGDFAQLLDETPGERARRQATTRRLEILNRRLKKAEGSISDIEYHELDDIESRIVDLESLDLDDLERRVEEVDSMQTRISELEDQIAGLASSA